MRHWGLGVKECELIMMVLGAARLGRVFLARLGVAPRSLSVRLPSMRALAGCFGSCKWARASSVRDQVSYQGVSVR